MVRKVNCDNLTYEENEIYDSLSTTNPWRHKKLTDSKMRRAKFIRSEKSKLRKFKTFSFWNSSKLLPGKFRERD
jgi:hypothetical protein